jgi:hypothetical protein
MCLRLVFLLITRIAAWLRLSRREETWKTAEILLLRHQLAVLQRQQPAPPKAELGGPGSARDPLCRADPVQVRLALDLRARRVLCRGLLRIGDLPLESLDGLLHGDTPAETHAATIPLEASSPW